MQEQQSLAPSWLKSSCTKIKNALDSLLRPKQQVFSVVSCRTSPFSNQCNTTTDIYGHCLLKAMDVFRKSSCPDLALPWLWRLTQPWCQDVLVKKKIALLFFFCLYLKFLVVIDIVRWKKTLIVFSRLTFQYILKVLYLMVLHCLS